MHPENHKGIPAYRIHAANKGEIAISVVFRSEEKAGALSNRQVDHICDLGLRVNPIHLKDGHAMPFKPQVLPSKGADVGHSDQVCFSWLHRY